ncbi:hypothetical protein [Paraburkholderia fungorum]|uniref:hypothetical protein n=1 Tax=Paraburkholderia fungorum TaxID=134537 RepID=UPI0038B8E244
MLTVTLQGAKNLTRLAQRIYGLDAADPRVAAAVRAITTANPKLPAALDKAPAETTVMVPTVPGLAFAAGAIPAPGTDDLVRMASQIPQAIQQLVSAAQSKKPKQSDPTRVAMLKRFADAQSAMNINSVAVTKVDGTSKAGRQALHENVTAFAKTHRGG